MYNQNYARNKVKLKRKKQSTLVLSRRRSLSVASSNHRQGSSAPGRHGWTGKILVNHIELAAFPRAHTLIAVVMFVPLLSFIS